MSNSKANKAAKKAAKAVAAAYRTTLGGGNYGAAIAAKQARAIESKIAADFGAMTRAMYAKTPKAKRTPAEKAARKRVLSAHKSSAARAARLPGGKRSKTAPKAPKKGGAKAAVAAAARRATTPKKPKKPPLKTVTADSVIKDATTKALTRWLCQGPRRSGCGAGGSRVITGQGRFIRIRPERAMTGG